MEILVRGLYNYLVKYCNLLNLPSEGYRAGKVASLIENMKQKFIHSVDTFTIGTDPLICFFESSVRVTRAQERKIIKFKLDLIESFIELGSWFLIKHWMGPFPIVLDLVLKEAVAKQQSIKVDR